MLRFAAVLLLLMMSASIAGAQSRNASSSWLNGTWEGKGYQIDTDETWTMRLVVTGRKYLIEYPSLNCGGRWRPVSISSWIGRFKEKITHGVAECTDKGSVVIERLSRRQIAFRYSNPGAPDVVASAILNRKK